MKALKPAIIDTNVVSTKPTRSAKAEELLKAKTAIDQFLYSCSHSLRGPLKSISGLVNLLRASQDNPDLDPKMVLTSIDKTVKKMESLLNELEQFLANSKKDLTTRAVDSQRVMTLVMGEYLDQLGEKGITFDMSIDASMPLYTDEGRLRVIFSNLIGNAIVFHDAAKQKKEIFVGIKVFNDHAEFEVRDNGIGMPSDVQSKIFDLFFRGSQQSTGCGVGLYIVKEVLDKMGGDIRVFSSPGQGTTFSFTIPNLSTDE
ncbi:MAG: HAMP domain-containing histidine kinase [Bacteroidia bacterium]|nr:HAMP domain-containing histidine kinase [Bacteroidia bacterium]